MPFKYRGLFLFALMLGLIGSARSASEQSYEVSVTTVTVWVKAVDGAGKPIPGLTQSDFEVFEDKQRVEITCFEESQTNPSAAAADTEPETTGDAKRFVLYLDLFNTSAREFRSMLPALLSFLESADIKGNEIMVAGLLSNRKLGVILPFTKDVARVKRSLQLSRANQYRDATEQRRSNELSRALQGSSDVLEAIQNGYRTANYLAQQEENESRLTLAAIRSFAAYLSEKDPGGHIVIVYISGGFSAAPGRRYFEVMDDLANDYIFSSNQISVEAAMRREPNFDLQREIQTAISSLNRVNFTLYTINTRGMSREVDYQDALQRLADETGGVAVTNTQNFTLGLENILEDLDHSYTICYRSPEHRDKNKYRRIKVVAKKSGVHVRHREGYID